MFLAEANELYLMRTDVLRRKEVHLHPALRGLTQAVCRALAPDAVAAMQPDTVFLCTPNEVSHEWVPALSARGIRVVDLSGAFRLSSRAL